MLNSVQFILNTLVDFISNILKQKYSVFAIIIIVIMYFIYKTFYQNFTNKGRDSKSKICMKKQDNIIWNINPKPILFESNKFKNKTLKEFHIATSHNTYIPCTQNADIADVLAIKRALLLGARAIELDVFSDKTTLKPIVAHGVERGAERADILTTTSIPFQHCLDIIKKYAFQKTTDPIFIILELNTNKMIKVNNEIAKMLKNTFKDQLYKQNKKVSLGDIKLKDTLNKVIVLSGGGSNGDLNKIIYSTWHDQKMKNIPYTDQDLKEDEIIKFNETGMTRVYPAGTIEGHFSLNYDFEVAFEKGCQFIAMNYQTIDDNMNKYLTNFKNSSFLLKK